MTIRRVGVAAVLIGVHVASNAITRASLPVATWSRLISRDVRSDGFRLCPDRLITGARSLFRAGAGRTLPPWPSGLRPAGRRVR